MLNETAISRLALMGNALRPEWPQKSLVTIITANLSHRAYQDVACALAWVATDKATTTPGRLLEHGPWWKARGEDVTETAPRAANACQVLGHGSYLAHNCGACKADELEATPEARAAADTTRATYSAIARDGAAKVRAALGPKESM